MIRYNRIVTVHWIHAYRIQVRYTSMGWVKLLGMDNKDSWQEGAVHGWCFVETQAICGQNSTPSCLMLIKMTTITYGQNLTPGLWILPLWNDSSFYKHQAIKSTRKWNWWLIIGERVTPPEVIFPVWLGSEYTHSSYFQTRKPLQHNISATIPPFSPLFWPTNSVQTKVVFFLLTTIFLISHNPNNLQLSMDILLENMSRSSWDYSGYSSSRASRASTLGTANTPLLNPKIQEGSVMFVSMNSIENILFSSFDKLLAMISDNEF